MIELIDEIRAMVGPSNVFIEPQEIAYARMDRSNGLTPCEPLAVIRVLTVGDLIAVSHLCIKKDVPIVIRAGGTGKTGGAIAARHHMLIDISRLNRIIEIDTRNLTADVEPGVILADLQRAVSDQGLFYPPDPASASICTIGGNVAENASGPSTLKYGSTRDYVLGGQAVIGTGEVIDFGKRCPKGVAGYDIAALLTGSEGTLGIFTRLILRLLPKPKSTVQGLFLFFKDEEAPMAVSAMLQSGHRPKAIEYIDDICLMALRRIGYAEIPEDAKAALIIECDAMSERGAFLQIAAISSMLKNHSLMSERIYDDTVNQQMVWHMRASLSMACTDFLGQKLSEDIAVPLGSILAFKEIVRELSKPPHVLTGLFGHAGDGNMHVQIMYDGGEHEPIVRDIRNKILQAALSINGTIAAEHGIGIKKKSWLLMEQAPSLIELQKRIKIAFDPKNLLNPGKIFDI